jgi:hypothetical protein
MDWNKIWIEFDEMFGKALKKRVVENNIHAFKVIVYKDGSLKMMQIG